MEDRSPSASLAQPSFLQRTLERLSSTQCVKLSAEEAAPVAVIALQRYLSEPGDGSQPLDSFSYDATVTDGLWRIKCFIHPSLNHLVHRNLLRTGTDIRITQCSFVYNERRLGHGFIRIEDVSCGSGSSAVLPRVEDVRSLGMLVKPGMERSMLLHSDVPLQPSRKHYLPLWNNDDPEGDAWSSAPPPCDAVLDVSKISLLNSLEGSFWNKWTPLPLLVRIIQKSRIRYYGKFGLKIEFPFQAYFEVADQSGTMSLVLWNELCPEFYHRLRVGSVLYLQNYTLKQSYSNRSRPRMDHYRLKTFQSVEICLNSRNPTSVITVVSPKNVLPHWRLPDVCYQFTTRSELEKHQTTPNNTKACDVIGLVTFVGRIQRVKSKGNIGPEKYWTYRWVHAVDGTSERPFILEVFSSSQPEIFDHICPMTYLVCTQMRVCQVDGSPPYLTSSCETEMFITGYHKGQPYVNDPTVKNFIQWTKTLKDKVILQRTAVGGHYCYPHSPQTFTQSTTEASVVGHIPLVAASDLKEELETLQYREHKKLAIQGQITAVRYLKQLRTRESRGGAQVPDISPDAHERTASTTSTSPTVKESSASKRRIQQRNSTEFSLVGSPAKRSSARVNAAEEREKQEEDDGHQENPGGEALSWVSSSWTKQRQQVSEHLNHGGLYQDSICRRFMFDEKDVLLQWSNLHPMRWTPERSTNTVPPVVCPGYFQITILGINKQIAVDAAYYPVVGASEPRAVGLPQAPHDNTMLSCLSSGFFYPLSGASEHPEPEDVLASAAELEDTHVVCILDLCHLGGDEVEVLVNKVFRVTELSLDGHPP